MHNSQFVQFNFSIGIQWLEIYLVMLLRCRNSDRYKAYAGLTAEIWQKFWYPYAVSMKYCSQGVTTPALNTCKWYIDLVCHLHSNHYTIVQIPTPLFKSLHHCSSRYTTVQVATPLFKSLHRCSSRYTTVQVATPLFESLHHCSNHYTTAHQNHSPKPQTP